MADEDRFKYDGDVDSVTAAGLILEDGQREIADACRNLLSRLAEPDEMPNKTWFRGYFSVNVRQELCDRAAFAALAVLLEAPGMDLPVGIETAFTIPEKAP